MPSNAPSSPGPPIDARLDGAALRDLLRELPTDLAQSIAAGARPAVRFATQRIDPASAPPGLSRFGGAPDLPAGRAWPTWQPPGGSAKRALAFFAQVRLDGLAGVVDVPLPEEGLLSFFCDFDFQGGITGLYADEHEGSQVVHLDASDCVRRETPAGMVPLPAAVLQPVTVTTIALSEDGDLDDEDYDTFDACEQALEAHVARAVPEGWDLGGRHQLGGHARYIQHPVEEEALQAAAGVYRRQGGFDTERWMAVRHEVPEWRLLLQLDSDDTLDVMWGDVGTVYWVARADRLAAGAWSDVWFNFQCS